MTRPTYTYTEDYRILSIELSLHVRTVPPFSELNLRKLSKQDIQQEHEQTNKHTNFDNAFVKWHRLAAALWMTFSDLQQCVSECVG